MTKLIDAFCERAQEIVQVLMCVVKHREMKWRGMRWSGHVASMEDRRGVYRVWVGKPDGKRTLGRPRRRWEDNIKMDLEEWEGRYGLD